MKLLVGRHYDAPDVQRELTKLPFKAAKLPHGGVGIYISYDNEQKLVSAEHSLAMMMVLAKETVNKANNGVNIGDAVFAVPNWFTESQRIGFINACEIASLPTLKIANESTLVALSYGIFKSAKNLFSPKDSQYIMFVDIGYSCYTVTIVDFIQENMKVMATVCDKELGGRDFDDIIIEYMAEQFEAKTKINVRNNRKAVLKMQIAAEKAKKTLSPAGVNEAIISVECLSEDHDLNCRITREEFENRCSSLFSRLEAPLNQCLTEAGLTKEQIFECELVGGSSRVNMIKICLGKLLGLDNSLLNSGLKTTMNADEAVARGGALQCAMLSSRMKVKPFKIIETLYYGLVVSWDKDNSGDESEMKDEGKTDESEVETSGDSAVIYTRGAPIPQKAKRLTFRNKSKDFTINVSYDDSSLYLLPSGESKLVAKYTIRVPESVSATGPKDVRVTLNLDKNGLVYVQTAQSLETIIVEETSEDSKVPESKDGNEGEEKATPVPTEPKKKLKKTDLVVDSEKFGLTNEDIKITLELEASMSFEDKLIVETSDRRNELESYIYAIRDKLDGSLSPYSKKDEKDRLQELMVQAEDWLYGDGFDSTKQQYIRKLDELRAIGIPIENRVNEETNRGPALNNLKIQIENCKTFAANYDESLSHITEEDRAKIREKSGTVEAWAYDMQTKQGDVPLNCDPVLTCDAIQKERTALFTVTNPIMIKKKPLPPPPEKKAEEKVEEKTEDKTEEKTEDEGKTMDESKDEGKTDEVPLNSEDSKDNTPMEI
jgi:heat shock protein 4